MRNTDLTQYDIKPEAMINYLRYNGPHFNKKLCEFAVSLMEKKIGNTMSPIVPMTKDDIDKLLKDNNITIKGGQLYDHVFVANMCKADFLGSSIVDNLHLAMYVKDVLDDDDAYDGIVFNRWYADMCRKGIVVDWEEMI
jgi:hypothetical protein